ncbi:MAG: hypothetical protein JHC87_04765 [Thermoleophilaceae bacterium]|nr:hypothetical protein [Thermoleophilaceae bacterium]
MLNLKSAARALATLAACCVVAIAASNAMAANNTPPSADPFYSYDGSTPLASIAPGTVLKTRDVSYHVASLAFPLKTTQLLYRSTSQIGEPTVNVTTVVQPLFKIFGPRKVISYQSAYDSLSSNDDPSYAISGGLTLGGILPAAETALIAPFLLKGYAVVISDTEGEGADFAAGPEYGMNTLDSIRAAFNSSSSGFSATSKVGLIGYSGGAIATEWASELAPTYAPDVNRRLVGAAMGGVLVHPAHNLHYVDGSTIWAGVMPMAVVGIARAFHVDLKPYLSDYGLEVYDKIENSSIIQVLGAYPGLTWTQLAKPEYSTPESIPVYVQVANQLIMGTGGTPKIPLFIGQGANGALEGTPNDKPGIGPGDGVMIAGDVRSLARKYCAAGVKVTYNQYDNLSHVTSIAAWLPRAITWMTSRFSTTYVTQNCSSIAPGNPLDPIAAP